MTQEIFYGMGLMYSLSVICMVIVIVAMAGATTMLLLAQTTMATQPAKSYTKWR